MESRTHLSVARPAHNTGTGFFVANGNVYDANGELFVRKGVNAIHAWGSYNTNYATIDQVAKTGANAVRAVMYQDIAADPTNNWTDAANTPARRKAVVERYLAHGIVAVVEDHASIQDSNSQSSTAALAEITTHWLDNAAWLKQHEKGVILNIANEWGPVAGANGSNTVWRDTYIAQVLRLRKGPDGTLGTADDITNLIEIDAGGWGQDYNTLALHAQAVQDADPQHNIVFSIHLYGQWRDEGRPQEVFNNNDYGPWDIATKLGVLRNRANPLPLVIGEFAWEDFRDFANSSAPYSHYRTQRVLQIADQLGIGWSGWSYNQSSPLTLNVLAGSLNNTAYNSNADLSEWGDAIINDPVYGMKASAKRASVFPMAGLPAAPAGLPALPAAPAAEMKLVLSSTRTRIAEGGQGTVQLKLSKAPSSPVTIAISKVGGGDASLLLDTISLTFTPENWSQYQPIFVSAGADADAAIGSARFNVASTGLQTNDFTVREIDAQLPVGPATLAPIADRRYADGGTATSVGVTNVATPQPTGALFMKFDAGGRGGKATAATLRVFKTNATSNMTMRLYLALTDNWSESSTSGIHASIPVLSKLVPNAANVYVDFDVSAIVASELYKDGLITFALTTASGSATIATRESTTPPQLVITTAEAVPPRLIASAFEYEPNIDRLRFQFDEDVSTSLAATDLVLESITDPSATPLVLDAPTYDAATNTALFTFAPGTVPNGRYRATLVGNGVADASQNTMLVSTSLEFFSLAGDANRDGITNFGDLVILAQNYNQTDRVYAQGDLNGDGTVNFGDLVILAQNYNLSLPTATIAAATIQSSKAKRIAVARDVLG